MHGEGINKYASCSICRYTLQYENVVNYYGSKILDEYDSDDQTSEGDHEMDNRKISYRVVATELRKRTSKNDVQRMSTDNMAADIFTKSLLEAVFKKHAMRIQGMAQQR